MILKRPVLYAEDDPNDVVLFQFAMQRAHCHFPLRVVQDGVEARDYLSGTGEFSDRIQNPLPHLVLVDIHMPRLNGLELIAWFRQAHPESELPFVIFSSSGMQTDIDRARKLGVLDYLVKPHNIIDLTKLVKSLNHRFLAPIARR